MNLLRTHLGRGHALHVGLAVAALAAALAIGASFAFGVAAFLVLCPLIMGGVMWLLMRR